MANLLSTVFKSKKSKIIGAAVLVAAVAGGSALYINTQNAKIPAVTLATVTKGEITKSVTITGDIKASTRNVISLSPTSKVVDVFVKEGQTVKKGDILAVLDTADLKNQLKQQNINLVSAKSTLAFMAGPSSSSDKTSAGNAVSQAQVALANAQSNYNAAQNNVGSIQQADNNAVSQAQIALDNANANYTAAQNNLDAIQTADDNAVSQAQIALNNAEVNYRAAKQNIDNNLSILESQLQYANGVLSTAQTAYNTVYNKFHAIPPIATPQQLDDATTALHNAQNAVLSLNSQINPLKQAEKNANNAVQSAQVTLDNAQAKADSDYTAAEKSISDADNAVKSAQVSLSSAQTKADSDNSAANKAASDASNAVKSAEITLSSAKNTASFTGSSDSEKISNQKTQISLLNANIENLNNKIEQGNLRANVDGVVTKMNAVANQYPVAGDEIIVDGSVQYVVELQASQYDSVNIKAGQKVNVTLKGISKKYDGTVSEIGQLAEKSLTSTDQDPKVTIKVSITNPDANVVAGYQADAEIVINDKSDALQLSFEAIQVESGTGKKYVYAVDSRNKVKKTYIQTGIETDYNIEVLSGLTEGQRCISNPAKTITDGMTVKETGGKS
ncbi:MAG TPA: biotin/lipoyl-binding protein [Clostridiaceae bacterium]